MVRHSSRLRPAAWSARASAARWSSLPALASRSILSSNRRASNSSNQSRSLTRSSGERPAMAASMSSNLVMSDTYHISCRNAAPTCSPLVPIRRKGIWRGRRRRPWLRVVGGRVARLLRAALDAVPQALAVELGLDGKLVAVVGARELADRATALEGSGKLAGLAIVPARPGACGELAFRARARLALGAERVEQALPGHHRQRQRAAVRRGEGGKQPATRHLKRIAPIALPPLDPVPQDGLLGLLLAVPLRHGRLPGWGSLRVA